MSRFPHRHATGAGQRPSSAHVADVVRPSPARAEPHDATAWLPVPEPDGLPSVDDLLAAPPDPDAAPLRDVPIALPSPARAEPHDETSWLPLPEIEDLPPVEELLSVDAALEVPMMARELPAVMPSPARAEPHDETSWLPLPEVEDLPDITELVDPDRTEAPAGVPPAGPDRARRVSRGLARRRWVAVALVAATLAIGLYAVPKAFSSGDHHVQLQVDGRVLSADSGQSTVGAFLTAEKIKLGPADKVEPSVHTSLSNGMTVLVLRAFPVSVDLDGTLRTVYTAESLPQVFLTSLKLPTSVGVFSEPAKLQAGAVVRLRTMRKGTLTVDGTAVNYNLPVLTVRELITHYKVVLGPLDVTSPPVDSVIPVDNPFVNVIRVAQNLSSTVQPYYAPPAIEPDATMAVGTTRVQAGSVGYVKITYEVTKNNGVESGLTPVSQVPVIPAQPTITFFGTLADPHWTAIANCETGGNWAMVGKTYSGGLGIYNGTWNEFGGQQFASNPGLASREQQIIVAERIHAKYGYGAWGCGKKLGFG
jgi:uncharacterized protein YabE (DUF348 family)